MSMTIDDIVRKMRKDMPRVIDPKVILRNYADRIEKAVTICNQLKMRETVAETEKHIDKAISILEEIPETCGFAGLLEDACDVLCCLKEELVKPALSAPPRNCDRQYQNGYDVLGQFTAETGCQIFNTVDVVNWLLAEVKGGEK